ncbi:MAG: Ig-like domain repeat protein, partial [Acidobacteriota bacterium]
FAVWINGGFVIITLVNGQGSTTITPTYSGNVYAMAQYPGDSNYQGSNSDGEILTVDQPSATLNLQALPATVNPGQQINASVTITGNGAAPPTGTITFSMNGITVATQTIANGAASATFNPTKLGASSVVAKYSGDSTYLSTSTSAPVTVPSAPILEFNPRQTYLFAGIPGDDNHWGQSYGTFPATQTQMHFPSNLAVDNFGNVYVSDQGNDVIRKVDPTTGQMSQFAGYEHQQTIYYCNSGGEGYDAGNANFCNPAGMAFDAANNMYLADYSNGAIYRIDGASHVITTVAGRPGQSGALGDGPGTTLQLNGPIGVAVDKLGNVYWAEYGSRRVRKMDSSGNVTTVAGVYYGSPYALPTANELATNFALGRPRGVALDSKGNLYITDEQFQVIFKVDAVNQYITVYTGNGTGIAGPQGDGGLATDAILQYPDQLVVDAADNLYVGDAGHDTVRRIDALTGIITAVAGFENGYQGGNYLAPNGTPSNNTPLESPYGIAIDNAGSLYVSSTYDETVFKVGPNGALLLANTVNASAPLTLSNNGNAPLHFSATPYTITGDFTLVAPTNNACDFTQPLGAGTTCTINVQRTDVGTSGSIVFNDDALLSPQTTIVHVNANPSPSATALQVYNSPAAPGAEIDLVASIAVDGLPPSGTVSYYEGSTLLGVANLIGTYAIAELPITTLSVGSHNITAVYSGDLNYAPSTSDVQAAVVTGNSNAPVLTLPSNIVVEATSSSGAIVAFTATATDPTDGTVPVTCTPTSGSTFPIAATPVNCSATDKAGNTTTGSFTITVRDTTPPVLNLSGNFAAEATSPSGAQVSFGGTATDIVDGTDPVTCTPASPATLPQGVNTINCSATDKAGNVATGAITITVRDTTPPVLTLSGDFTAEAISPSGAQVSFGGTATDTADGTLPVTCTPSSPATLPEGVNTIHCSATDKAGNVATGAITIT